MLVVACTVPVFGEVRGSERKRKRRETGVAECVQLAKVVAMSSEAVAVVRTPLQTKHKC